MKKESIKSSLVSSEITNNVRQSKKEDLNKMMAEYKRRRKLRIAKIVIALFQLLVGFHFIFKKN